MTGFWGRAGYGFGGMVFSVKEAAYSTFVLLFYTQVLGLAGTAAGVALAVAVIFDAISDPIIGAWSDRLESRWGRRHPFMVAGTLPMGVGFIGLFAVPDGVMADQTLLMLWLMFWSIWIRTTLSIFAIPHLALSAEMTSDYRERSAILGARMFFVFLGTVLVPALALVFLFNQYGDVDGRFERGNYPVYGLISCIATWGVGLVTIWSTRRYAVPRPLNPEAASPGFRQFIADFLGVALAQTTINDGSERLQVWPVLAHRRHGPVAPLLSSAGRSCWGSGWSCRWRCWPSISPSACPMAC